MVRTSKVLKPGNHFKTGLGAINQITKNNSYYILIRTSKSKKNIQISKLRLEQMFAYFLRVRVIERKELEVFSSYSSTLFGILATIFKEQSKIVKLGNLLRLVKLGVRMYLAGGDRSPKDLNLASQFGAKYVLLSYYHCRKGNAWKKHLKNNGFRCILDCGKFSEWMAKQKGKRTEPINIDAYIKFIKENQNLIDHYFVFDEIGDPQQTQNNLIYMEKRGLNPIPIFHMGTPFDQLDKLVETGYPVIGIGGTVNQFGTEYFLKALFNKYPNVLFHGLGIGKASFISKYPFFSCDSSAWLHYRQKSKPVVLTAKGQEIRFDLTVIERLRKSINFLTSLENVTKNSEILNPFMQLQFNFAN